jgi:ankyrin repeat protein
VSHVRKTLQQVLEKISADNCFMHELTSVHSEDVEGATALHIAAWRGDLESVQVLIRLRRSTPASFAARQPLSTRSLECVKSHP